MAELLDRLNAAVRDRYHIERELGAGGMAIVYLAQDLKHHRPVALKVLKPELATALGPERFVREIAVAAQLDHPHIVPLHDSGEAAGFLFYVMPYVEGESLRERLKRETQLPLDDALQIAREVADALGYAHSRGLIHRDIKPENILLAGGHARVADFGIARAVTAAGGERLTETGIAIGTPTYMSPEQGSGRTDLDGRSDLYSLGCVVYEMLAGEPPYTGPTAQAVIAKRLSEPVPRVSVVREAVPEAVEQALTRALAKVPADRFATAQQFAQALTGPPSRRPWRWRWKVVAGVAAGAGLVAAALWVPGSPLARLRAGSSAAANTTPRPWTIVADFEGSADSTLRRTIRDVVRDALDESTIMRALPEQDVRRGLQLAGKSPESALDMEVARELAERHGLRSVVVGQVDRVGGGYALAVRVLDRNRGAVIAVARETAEGEDGIMPAIGRLVRKLRRELGERRSAIREDARQFIVPVGTRSLEAFRKDREARSLYRREGPTWETLALFREALALDSGFIRAWVGVGQQLSGLGFRDSALATFAEAHRWLGRESGEERLLLEINEELERGEYQRQLRAADRLVKLSPDSPVSHFWVGHALLLLGRYEESVAAFDQSEALEPVAAIPQTFFNRVQSLVMLGRLGEAWALAERATGVWRLSTIQVAGVRDDWAFADSVATAFERDPATANLRAWSTPLRASVLASRGAVSAAVRALEQSHRRRILLAMYSGRPVPGPQSTVAADTAPGAIVTSSVWAAAAGDTLTALRRITALEARLGDRVLEYGAWPQFVRSLVAAQGGRWTEVIALLAAKAVDPRAEDSSFARDIVGAQPLRWLVARAYEQLGQLDSAVAYYELVISPRVWGPYQARDRGLPYSFAHQRLVVLHARLGRVEDARRHWIVFSETFTNPDPDLRWLVDEAREALRAAERRAG